MVVKQIKITDLKPYPKNAKKHPQKQIKQIADSIKEFGFRQPVVVDKDNTVIVGHGRIEAAKLLAMAEVPTIIVTDLTDEQIRAYRLADNKLNESDWDMALVIEELKDIKNGVDITLTGFDQDLLLEAEDKDDDIPVDPPTVAKLGDVWQLGKHRLVVGDSTKKEDVEKLMGGGSGRPCAYGSAL